MRSPRPTIIALTLVVALAVGGCKDDPPTTTDAGKGPLPAAAGIDEAGHMHPGDADRCPVCAMTTKDKKTVAAIELDDGKTFYFCGTGCMLKSWLHPEVFLGTTTAKPKRAVVTEFYTGDHVGADQVTWIAGSDVTGPMGPMIVPVAGDEAVAKFKERHGGKVTFSLGDLDDAKWEAMTGKKATATPPAKK